MEKNLATTVGNTGLYIVRGDITKIPSDAIMTAINSGGMWFGGVDGAIQKVANNHYHNQAMAQMPLSNLQIVVAKGDQKYHLGEFNDVVFIVDDLESPVNEIIYKGLEAANKEGYEKVLLPAVRMGVMMGAVEKDVNETVKGIAKGVKTYMQDYGSQSKLKDIDFVVHSNPETIKQLEKGLLFID